MLSQRSVSDGIAANPTDDDVQIAQRKIQTVEDQATALARAMQKMHGGRWGGMLTMKMLRLFLYFSGLTDWI